jgi:vacuolar-type H+-ATPase subunit I/STV1
MGQRFEIPNLQSLGERANETNNEIRKSRQLLTTSTHQLQQYLYEMNSMNQQDEENVSTLEIYMWFVAKEKAIYNALNMMKSRSATYIAFMWAPLEYESKIKDHLSEFHSTEFNKWKTEDDGHKKIIPPTHFKQNDFSFIHQFIVDMYNVPTY